MRSVYGKKNTCTPTTLDFDTQQQRRQQQTGYALAQNKTKRKKAPSEKS